jgi:hypothetical protein
VFFKPIGYRFVSFLLQISLALLSPEPGSKAANCYTRSVLLAASSFWNIKSTNELISGAAASSPLTSFLVAALE